MSRIKLVPAAILDMHYCIECGSSGGPDVWRFIVNGDTSVRCDPCGLIMKAAPLGTEPDVSVHEVLRAMRDTNARIAATEPAASTPCSICKGTSKDGNLVCQHCGGRGTHG